MARKKKEMTTEQQQLTLDGEAAIATITGQAPAALMIEFRNGNLDPSSLSTELDPSLDNAEGFDAYHGQIKALAAHGTDVETLIAHRAFMICNNSLWKYADNPDAPESGIKFVNQDQYLDFCRRDTGVGFSTLKRNIQAIKFAKTSVVNMTDEQIARVGIVPIAQVSEAMHKDNKTAEPSGFKHRTLRDDEDLGTEIVHAIEALAHNRENPDVNLRNGDTRKLQRELLERDKVSVYVDFNKVDAEDPNRYWTMDFWAGDNNIIRQGLIKFDADRPDGSLWIGFMPYPDPETGKPVLPKDVMEFVLSKFGLGKK